MKKIQYILLPLVALCCIHCTDSDIDKNMPDFEEPQEQPQEEEEPGANYIDGFTFSPEVPTADDSLTITFKANSSSALYGFEGEAYLHTGIISEGVWLYVPAEWSENLAKCKFESIGSNTWQIELSPSIREWFSSEETPVEQLGVIIRSEDGTLKGLDSDYFVEVEDELYSGFQPAEKVYMSVDAAWSEGINILSSTSAALVLYDVDASGQSKDYAYVIGSFNDWTLSNDPSSQMYRDDAAGVWWALLEGLSPSEEHTFQYYVGTAGDGSTRLADPYSTKILDPDNDKYIPSSTYSENLAYPDGGIGIVSAFSTSEQSYAWQNPSPAIDKSNLVIYEMLLRDFTTSGDLAGAMAKLDYVASLGVNAIELMPLQEFDGNDSWGYNPAFYFALDKAYGTPSDYKLFIDECHARGLAVILDVVYNHTTGNHPFAKLYWDSSNNIPAANNPYYNQEAPHPYSVFNDLNHESTKLRDHVKRNLVYLLEEYRFDGFRFDLTKGFTQTSSTESTSSNYDASRIAILSDYHSVITAAKSDAVMILEHFCDYSEELELAQKGMLLWRNANDAFCQSAMGYSSDSAFDGIYVDALRQGWVGYMESHDEERMAYKQQVWGDGLLKSDLEVQMKQLAVNAAFSMLTPGPKMIWQFGEMGYDYSINSDESGTIVSEDYRTSRKPIRWDYLDVEARGTLVEEYSRLLGLRADNSELFERGTLAWSVSSSDWYSGRYLSLSYEGQTIVVMGNFTSDEITSTASLSASYTWYDFDTQTTTEESVITIAPNNYRLFTNFAPHRQ
ncbi:MAG: alpha-amylase family glycosyl hydrolase [Rikenellaceae bacterium]